MFFSGTWTRAMWRRAQYKTACHWLTGWRARYAIGRISTKGRTSMKLPLAVLALCVPLAAFAQSADRVGKVGFPNSCSPAVQEKLLRGIAMLHSFYYSATQRAFEEVAAEDPSCAIAAWGYASILMSNPLQGIGASPKSADLAQATIDQGRKIGAKTPRERDYLEAVAAYYEDFAN